MSIYDKSSLVLIPSGTKTGKVYSQKPVSGDGDFTFTRSSAATRVNADGNIEKETQNLLLQSNTFDTTWLNQLGGTITGGQAGYDGTNDAWLISKSASNFKSVRQVISFSGVTTFSVYAKAGTLTKAALRMDTSAGAVQIIYDLSAGVVSSSGGVFISNGIEDVGNGWYRIFVSVNVNSGTNVHIYVDRDGTTAGNILIQDAQIEQGMVARDVITTTTTAVEGGITDNVPRLDYTDSSCPALLLEPQRTNLVTNSEWLEGGFSLANGATLSLENVTAPDGSNLVTKVQANSDDAGRAQDGLGTLGTNHIWSGFFKGTGVATRLRFRNNQGKQVQYNINASGDFSLYSEDAVNGNYDIEDYGNGWHRIWFETTTTGATSNFVQIYPDVQNGTGSVYAWGLQAEAGSYATSYIYLWE